MDSELSSVEEFEDSAALVESSDQELLSDQENGAETQYDEEEDEAADDFLGEEEDEAEDDEDDYQEDEKEEEEYKPETKRITAKVHKPRKPKRQTTIKKAKDVPIPSRQSSRVRKHVDYDQTINDEEFLDDIAIQEEEEKPGATKKRKSKIELIEDDQDDDDDDDEDLDDRFDDQEDLESTGFGAEDEDDEDNNAINNDIDTDMNDVDDADDDRTDSPGYSNSETPETTVVKNQQRRSQMLENLIGLQAKRHGNRKELTEEEMQLRKAETARKRKNFIEKRLEEEKQDVLNKLLKRRATKTKSDPKSINTSASNGEDEATYSKQRRPYITAGMTRTIINKTGITYSLP